MTQRTLTLWDSSAEPPRTAGLVYTWNGHAQNGSAHSLFRYVEAHGERLRRMYLAWVHDLGENQIDGKRMIDHLAFKDGLSYWWMTLLAEKDFLKSPAIHDAIRLLAFEEILVKKGAGSCRLVSVDRRLHEVLRDLCQRLGLAYEWQRHPDCSSRQLSFRRMYRALPPPVRALINLARYLWRRWALRGTERAVWFGGDNALFFCSYFGNVDSKAAEQGRFHSPYWAELHSLLNRSGWRQNWLQLFVPCAAVPDSRTALSYVQRFNRQRHVEEAHLFLDAYLSWRLVLRVLLRWVKLVSMSWRLHEIRRAFRPQGSQLSLWPLMRTDWSASMRGTDSLENMLWIELFDMALRDLPHQKKGLYLCENQAWERAFIHAWRKHGHGELIAVAHVTVRFWDLRYSGDPRTVRGTDSHPMPQADLLVLNGKPAVGAYLNMDYPKEAIVECEALRYDHLRELRARPSAMKATGNATKVLIVGGFGRAETIRLLQLLEEAAPLIPGSATYTLKPHPYCPVETTDYPTLRLELLTDPLGKILSDFDIVCASNSTSAAVDAYFSGLPVVVALNETMLNLSPLRGHPGARFVSTPEELADALRTPHEPTVSRPDGNEFFFLDPELPRWSRLLAN